MNLSTAARGARLLARSNPQTSGVLQAQYSSQGGQGGKRYRQDQQKKNKNVATLAASAAAATAAITFYKDKEKKPGMLEVFNSKAAEKKATKGEQELNEEENRVRQHLPPDKVFNHFAGYMVVDDKGKKNVMMSPLDLYNAIVPDNHLTYACGPGTYTEVTVKELPEVTKKLQKIPDPDNDSVLNAIGKEGLLSYSDFCVLLTLLSTPKRYIDTAFQLFDVTGEGTICAKEFAYVSSYMSYKLGGFGSYTEVDQEEILASNSGLLNYLFGKERQGRITKEEFYALQSNLLDEIIELQFAEYDKNSENPMDGRISEVDFCKFLLQTAKIPPKKKQNMLKRVEKRWPTQGRGVSRASFKNIYHVLAGGADLERALFYLDVEGIGVDHEEFVKISTWVSQVSPSPHVAEVMFLLLDDNGDGRLYQDTLAPVLIEWRHSRGFDKGAIHIMMGQLKV